MAPNYSNQLQKIFEVQAEIQDIHPYLEKVFPVAVVENDQFWIYDTQPHNQEYVLIQKAATPMPIPAGVRAAFPLESYDNHMVCVVTGDVFNELAGYVTIFHEFIHCQQSENCEAKLKQKLAIARKAQAAHDFMWEINHSFPYASPEFEQLYETFLAEPELAGIEGLRQELKTLFSQEDYEYLVWQEWKEGFARYIENRIQRRLELPEDHGCQEPPFSRVTFYAGGAHFIAMLGQQESGLLLDIEQLFDRMF